MILVLTIGRPLLNDPARESCACLGKIKGGFSLIISDSLPSWFLLISVSIKDLWAAILCTLQSKGYIIGVKMVFLTKFVPLIQLSVFLGRICWSMFVIKKVCFINKMFRCMDYVMCMFP